MISFANNLPYEPVNKYEWDEEYSPKILQYCKICGSKTRKFGATIKCTNKQCLFVLNGSEIDIPGGNVDTRLNKSAIEYKSNSILELILISKITAKELGKNIQYIILSNEQILQLYIELFEKIKVDNLYLKQEMIESRIEILGLKLINRENCIEIK